METLVSYGVYIAIAALMVVLVLGMINLTQKSDEKQISRSNQLMRMRVIVQFVVIVMLVLMGIVFGAIKFG